MGRRTKLELHQHERTCAAQECDVERDMESPKDRLEEALELYKEKQIRPVAAKIFEFDQPREAFESVAKGSHSGKAVIKVAMWPWPRPPHHSHQ